MLLKVEGLRGGFALGVDILNGIDLQVARGEIVTVAGTNGAGKSTLIKAVMGLLPRCSGGIALDGKDLSTLLTEDRVACGVAYVPQVQNIFASLTVHENLDVVEARISKAERRRRIEEVLEQYPALKARSKVRGDFLSGGERQQLAFARALMLRPKLMLLDEPSAALSVSLARQVFEQIKSMPQRDVTVLVVEQQARQSLTISDRGYILDGGKIVMQGPAAMLLADRDMASLYLGQAPSPANDSSQARRLAVKK